MIALFVLGWLALGPAHAAAPVTAPHGVLLLADGRGGWTKELAAMRAQFREIAVESVESEADKTAIQRGIDRLRARRVSKIVAIPLEGLGESPVMPQLQFLFGTSEFPAPDRPDAPHEGNLRAQKAPSPFFDRSRSRRLLSEVPLVLTDTIDRSPWLAAILADRAKALSRRPERETIVVVGIAPRSDAALGAWATAAQKIAEAVRERAGFRSAGVIWVRDGIRAAQKEKDRSTNNAALRRWITAGGVVLVPLAGDGKRIGAMLSKEVGNLGYRWNGKGFGEDPRLLRWVRLAAEAGAGAADARHFRDNAAQLRGEKK